MRNKYVISGTWKSLGTSVWSWENAIGTCMCDYRRGFELDIGFIDHLYTRLGTTSNYNAIADFHTWQIITSHAMFFQPAASSPGVPWQRFVTLDILQLNSLKSSLNGCCFPAASFLHRLPYRTELVAPIFFLTTPRHGPHRNNPFPAVLLLLLVDSLLRDRVYRAVAYKCLWYIRLSRGRRVVTVLHATHLSWVLMKYPLRVCNPFSCFTLGPRDDVMNVAITRNELSRKVE
jgi:hypothetical protein